MKRICAATRLFGYILPCLIHLEVPLPHENQPGRTQPDLPTSYFLAVNVEANRQAQATTPNSAGVTFEGELQAATPTDIGDRVPTVLRIVELGGGVASLLLEGLLLLTHFPPEALQVDSQLSSRIPTLLHTAPQHSNSLG